MCCVYMLLHFGMENIKCQAVPCSVGYIARAELQGGKNTLLLTFIHYIKSQRY